MKSKLATIIMGIVIFLIIGVFVLFGFILWNEFLRLETSVQPENVKTVISENKDIIDKDIKAPEIIESPLDNIRDSNMQDSNTQVNNQADYSKVVINKYFYNQLEEYAQTIYKAFETNKENMKTGTYKVELGNFFTSLLQESNGQEKLGDYYQSAIEAYTYDNPDVFYLSPNKMYLNVETTTRGNQVTYNVYINSGNEPNYLIDEFSSKEQIDQAISEIQQAKNRILQNKKSNIYDNIKMVHDYLVENIEYDTTISKRNIYNIYGAMVSKEAVCEGYARSFKYLMDSLRNTMYSSNWKGNQLRGKNRKSCLELCTN